jgi:hypothetical protein
MRGTTSKPLATKKAGVEKNVPVLKLLSFDTVVPHLFEMERQGNSAKLIESSWKIKGDLRR